VRSSLFFRRLVSNSGAEQNITMPITNIGMNSMPIISHPFIQLSVPAGANINAPKSNTPARYFVRADISSFMIFYFNRSTNIC
jgi:hypothetical protein